MSRSEKFINECKDVFRFLVDSYSFREPVLEEKRNISLVYVKADLAIEIIHDERERDIAVKLIKLKDGQRPKGFAVDGTGKKFRVTLLDILIKKGIRDVKLKEEQLTDCIGFVKDEETHFIRKNLCFYAHQLKKYAQDELMGSNKIFDLINTE